ncbi:MAG: chromosome segregation protein SMC, partial [Burkholderiaceae bacterium]|nr:chromosome segregation protein SMC [Burkholderiaceae bacterium]
LTRVEDILRELNGNLDKLEKQAEVAGRYRSLQDDGTLKLHQLWFLRHRDAAGEQQRIEKDVAAAIVALESKTAELRQGEAELETIRQAHYAASDELHASQGRLAEAALDVSRLEERIRYVVEGRQRAEQRLAELVLQTAQWADRRAQAEAELEQLAEQVAAADEHSEVLAAQAEEQADRLPGLEDAVRAAQSAAGAQRTLVASVQQQIQLLASESRNLDDQSRQLAARRERLAGEKRQLAAPDAERIAHLQQQFGSAEATREVAEARLAELSEQVPALDDARRARQAELNTEAARQTDFGARLDALRALQEKVQTEGKLRPWLAKHGLEGLAGLWTRIHIEPGWETALEAALRERINALEVGRVDTVRAFAADAPPAKLVFYTPPVALAPAPSSNAGLSRLSDLLRLGDAGLKALLTDWLEGVYAASSLDDALAARSRLQHGEVLMTREGHAVSAHAVSFYAPDSEQAGLLARAQDIENLDRQLRAQSLIAEEARSALIRAEAAYSSASEHLATARRESTEAQGRAHQLQVELLRLTQQAEQTQSRSVQLDDELAEIDAQQEELNERRATGEARFETLDIELATTQERHAELDDAVIQAERTLAAAREQLRTLERQAQESQFTSRSLAARRSEL